MVEDNGAKYMKLLEYEAKQLLRKAGVPVPESLLVRPGEPVAGTADFPLVVKSQVPVGGRGKAGGVRIVEHEDDFNEALERVALTDIKGYLPQSILVEPKLAIAKEHYLSLLIDRETASIQLIVHLEGGVEVETNTGFFRADLSPDSIGEVSETIARLFGEKRMPRLAALIAGLYECFVVNDATLLEINPLVRTPDGEYICADAKMELDDAARFRHPDWNFEDKPKDVNFVTLDESGEIATIANGAGLAMATVDAVAAHGMRPANFLDVGGGASKESILKSFNQIVEYKNVKAIVINIFAGITRCDEVARAIIAAQAEIDSLPPLFIRLAGTNFEEAAVLLRQEAIPTLATLEACLESAKEALRA